MKETITTPGKEMSAAKYASQLRDLREDIQPEGTIEAALVENLAVLLWRKGRYLRAEVAEITKPEKFKGVDSTLARAREAWDQ